ncbi:GNAT family N-acetyltransferase [Pseudotenacibaculum sp. MALMAid0570]|uniref:GNAT family N-acetyltransferase n=1 Tax=Pseudotenacibaculum sp. MALMAid0570 TaxID=3143938 RepID=UPI0032DE52E8
MSDQVQIIIATQNDVETISALAKITFNETFGHYFRDPNDLLEYFNRTFSLEKISESIKKQHNIFWLGLWNDVPVGYAKLKLNSSSEFVSGKNVSQLQKIYVLKNFLSKKVGSKLQEEMLTEAKNNQSEAIWLSVLKENKRAIQFYLKNDFKVMGEHDFQIGKEFFQFDVMVKDL